MDYEVQPSQETTDEWRVEAINHGGDGEVYVAIFSGPRSKQRAEEYASWKSESERRSDKRPVVTDRRPQARL